MRRISWLTGGAWSVVVVMAMVGLGVATAVVPAAIAAPTVKGDTAAWNEAAAAFRKLNALPGYRMKVRVTDGTVGSAEYAPPNFYWTIQKQEGTIESFVVGTASVVRNTGPDIPGGSMCLKGSGASTNKPFIMDLADVSGEITVTRKPDTVIDGTPVRAYGSDKIESGVHGSGAAYIGAKSGLPRRLVDTYPGDNGMKTVTLDYYDYGAKIAIALPPCG